MLVVYRLQQVLSLPRVTFLKFTRRIVYHTLFNLCVVLPHMCWTLVLLLPTVRKKIFVIQKGYSVHALQILSSIAHVLTETLFIPEIGWLRFWIVPFEYDLLQFLASFHHPLHGVRGVLQVSHLVIVPLWSGQDLAQLWLYFVHLWLSLVVEEIVAFL